MVRNLLVLPDGTEVFSGSAGAAILSLELNKSVNTGTELNPGAVCAAMAQITLLAPQGTTITAGDELTLYRVEQDSTRRQVGIFLAEKPQRTGSILKLTAYDRMTLLDKDLTLFLETLDRWPYTLGELAEQVCTACGLSFVTENFPSSDFAVEKFKASGITGRVLMSYVAQAAGCFCRANAYGQIELGWYMPAPVTVGPTAVYGAESSYRPGVLRLTLQQASVTENAGAVVVESSDLSTEGAGEVTLKLRADPVQQYCFSGGMTLEEYITAPVTKTVLRRTEQDVGTVWPKNAGTGNGLVITANPLLAALNADTLASVAQNLYERFAPIRYTPGTLRLPSTEGLDAGQILTVTDGQGAAHTLYVMQLKRTAAGDTVTCTGSPTRRSSSAVNNSTFSDLRGKVLQLRTDVDGLQVENADAAGKAARLQLDVDSIRGQVSAQSAQMQTVTSQLTAVEQTAQGIKLSVEKLENEGATKLQTAMGYTFDDSGLHIARQGQQMENLLDNTGMYVKRAGQVILQANDQGVAATDITVHNYLVVGSHARLENYTAGRTACFWLEGTYGT